MTMVKIDQVPSVPNPIEGLDYQVINGDVVPGDPVRIGERIFTIYTPQPEAHSPPAPLALSKSDFEELFASSGADLQTALDNWPTA